MKFIISTFLFGLILSFQLNAQETKYNTEFKAKYQVVYSPDSLHPNTQKEEVMYLFTGSEKGVFMNYPTAFKDEIAADYDRQIRTAGTLIIDEKTESNFSKVFYKDLQKQEVQVYERVGSKDYSYHEPAIPLEWKISSKQKSLLGYSVQKAETHFAGRDYIAWFTTEIPIPDGPYVFCGLPGLIIELYDIRNHYHFSLISINSLETIRTEIFPKSQEISKKELLDLKEKARKNQDPNLIKIGNIQMRVVDTPEMSQEDKMDNERMRRNMKKERESRNNPIELE